VKFASQSSVVPRAGGTLETGGGRSVPVLFATPHGLHIRSSSAPNSPVDSNAVADDQPAFGSGRDRSPSGGEQAPTRKCDVFGSVVVLRNDANVINTSD